MPEPLLRDYRKTEAERREVVRQKFLNIRKWLAPAAQSIFDRELTKWQAAMAEGDKAKTERRRQVLLARKAACMQHMSPEARELFERETGPAARNGNCPAVTDRGYQAEFEAETLTAQQVKEIWRKTRQVFSMAIARGDLANANRALHNFTRIQRLERSTGNDTEEQRHLIEAVFPSVRPLPGRPGGRPHTEEEKKVLKEIERLSSADRIAMCEGYEAAARYVELGGNLADLVNECSQAGGAERD